MTIKKKVPDLTERINPDLIYRTSNPIAKAVIGLGPTQTWEAVKRGELPPPVALTRFRLREGLDRPAADRPAEEACREGRGCCTPCTHKGGRRRMIKQIVSPDAVGAAAGARCGSTLKVIWSNLPHPVNRINSLRVIP